MTYQDFLTQKHFNQEELIAFAYGTLVDDPPADFDARLPAPPFLMIDRVLSFVSDGKRGSIIAEQDVRMDAWYFQCHMPGDPVHPGCLCVDAIWQLLGFYGVCRGALGAGRALGCGEVSFNGQIRPYNCSIRYGDLKKQLAEDMVKFLTPIREKIKELNSQDDLLRQIVGDGGAKARASAAQTMRDVREIIGIKSF